MKRKILCWLLLFGLYSTQAVAQTMNSLAAPQPYPAQDDGDSLLELRAALSGLDASRIPTGVLLDRMMFMTDPHRFAGQGFTQQY